MQIRFALADFSPPAPRQGSAARTIASRRAARHHLLKNPDSAGRACPWPASLHSREWAQAHVLYEHRVILGVQTKGSLYLQSEQLLL